MKRITLLLIVLALKLPEASLFAQTGPTYTDAYTGMEFIEVQPGTFTMGCTAEQGSDCKDSEKPAHQVTLTLDYYLGKYEVTQAQWKKVMGSNPSYSACDNCPVENISLADIKAFLKKLNAELKKAKPNTQLRYRLPTEAEWEYAARGGHKAAATSGKYAGGNTLGDVAWYKGNATDKIHPVGQKAANGLGLYDMSGNVWEWCSDFYGAYTAGAATNPKGPGSGESRVLRGGGWNGDAAGSRLTFRLDVKKAHIDAGFRLVFAGDRKPPVITSLAMATVAENTTGVVYTAVATDAVSTAAEITFSLSSGVKDNDLFSLSGAAVSFKAAPDYENPKGINKNKPTAAEKNVYELELTATDKAGNAGTKVVSITVTDVNELTYTDSHTSMAFVLVEKGTFTMGCTSEQSNCSSNERPTHSVTLTKDYYIGKYEVTQAQWRKVMGSNPSRFKNCDNCPVEQVSWNDVQIFITRLNAELKKAKPDTKLRYRLPTEAEWEYAARGGHKATSTKYAGSSSIGNVAWYSSNAGRKTHAVGGKAANELGLYDMSGNVLEWCSDRYGSYSSGAKTDPKGPSSGRFRLPVLRGGSWIHNARGCRVSYRGGSTPVRRYPYFGFRLCLSL